MACIALLSACDSRDSNDRPRSGSKPKVIAENIDQEEALEALRLQPVTDPVAEKVEAYRKKLAEHFYAQKFDELEKEASAARASKEVFGNGSWKIAQFYRAFERKNRDAQGIWNVTEDTLNAWLKAFPNSLTARIAYADFLTDYAWHARGTGYADTVTPEGWRLMGQRLSKADEVLAEARQLAVPEKEKDPVLHLVALRVALGKGPDKPAWDKIVVEGRAAEPTFWDYDVARAYSLLPRWYGEPGEWEAFASEAAERPDGPGVEVYARIVMHMLDFHKNVFKNSKASWPKTKEGLDILLKKYPDSLELLSYAAMLATNAYDNASAKVYFGELGDRYLEKSTVWPSKESFVHYRKWARTGKW
ncbi:DUF4034 domain-containing protein [Phragmitibacter flavus]|uniref:DUF4034 domain-containing protein n=1 Tax=Phragmitibacter flavus TaxID=2576071 RepID=UPI00140D55F8|nr:DUF4034 domain-containing protein [Phragmitibacter flavus]